MARRKGAAVSIDPELHARSKVRAERLGFSTWSAYVCQLIRADVEANGGGLIIRESASPEPIHEPRQDVHYSAPKKPLGVR